MRVMLLGLYYSCLISFSFVSHPVLYCVLLVTSALSISGYVYLILGFSWYLALFCLVYVGGVYVLFIFVSVHNPNPSYRVGGSFGLFFLGFSGFTVLFWLVGAEVPVIVDNSNYLCSSLEGISYCLFCLILMVGFVAISIVVGEKDSFFR